MEKDAMIQLQAGDLGALHLGMDRQTIHLAGSDDVRSVAATLAQQAQHGLLLWTPDLEATIYDRQPFLGAVSALVRRYPGAYLDVLMKDACRVVKEGHRLVELARRLGSSIQIRRCAQQYASYCGAFLLADDCGYLYRPLSSHYEGVASLNNSGEVVRLRAYFREVWEHSEPDRELRRLYL